MKQWTLLLASILLLTVTGWSRLGSAAPIDEVVAGAKKEGTLNLLAPSAITPKGAEQLAAAFNKRYGLSIQVKYIPTARFAKDTASLITQSALGVAPEWDIMLVTDYYHALLWRKGLHWKFDYRALGVDPKAIEHDNGTVVTNHGVVLPAYYSTVLPSGDAPRTWEDLLDPKWKDGKIGVSPNPQHWAFLAAGGWGEKKTTEFVRALAKLRPSLGSYAELSTRLQLGEILIVSAMVDSFVHAAKKAGAPIVYAEKVEPVIMLGYNAGVIKGAHNPNAARLFAAFIVTPEAQQIYGQISGQTSAFVPGTPTNKFVKGKQLVFMRPESGDLIDRLSNEYSKILGFSAR